MSIRTEIDRCIRQVTTGDNKITATLCFNKNFTGFQGHFPQNPVLPGICLLETVLVLIQRLKGRTVHMTELVVSKFFEVVTPGQEVIVDCVIAEDTVIAYVKMDSQKIAQIKIKVTYAS